VQSRDRPAERRVKSTALDRNEGENKATRVNEPWFRKNQRQVVEYRLHIQGFMVISFASPRLTVCVEIANDSPVHQVSESRVRSLKQFSVTYILWSKSDLCTGNKF
jgi:hypothetical protein